MHHLEMSFRTLLTGTVLCLAATSASASFVGDEITGCLRGAASDCASGNIFAQTGPVVVVDSADPTAAGDLEFYAGSLANYAVIADFDEGMLTITTTNATTNPLDLGPVVFEFGDIDWLHNGVIVPGGLVAVTEDFNNISKASAPIILDDGHGFSIQFDALYFAVAPNGGLGILEAKYTLEAAHKVPEPWSLTLLGASLLGLGLFRRSK